MRRELYAGSSPYVPVIGFSRAVRVGNTVYVSGTGPAGAEGEHAAGQAERAFTLIEQALARTGATMQNIVRTRIYLTDASDWQAVGAVHGRIFAGIRPAATMVVVAQLLNPLWRVEIEAEAVVSDTE